jgi:hypothetical protein
LQYKGKFLTKKANVAYKDLKGLLDGDEAIPLTIAYAEANMKAYLGGDNKKRAFLELF